MATPYPGMDPEYLKNLQAMIAAMGPSVADKDAAKYQGLLAMGLGLMGARKGQEFAAAGNAGLLGLDARNRSLAQATAEKGAGLNQALNAQQLQATMKSQADADQYRSVMKKIAEQDAGDNQPAPFGAQGGAPSVASFGPAIAPVAGSARLSTSKLSDYERAIQYAQKLEANGVAPNYVEAAWAKAEKLRPKYSTTPQIGMDAEGKPYQFVLDESGNEKRLNAAPTPKIREVNDNKTIRFLNDYNLPPNLSIPVQTTREGDANRAQALAFHNAAQAKEKGEQFGTPISITNDSGTSLYAPRKGTNELVPMVDGTGKPVSKAANIPQEYKNKAYIIANLEDDLKAYNDELSKITPANLANPNTAARIKAKYGAVQMGLKGLFELGVIAGPDMEIMAQNLTDPTSAKGMMQLYAGGLTEQNKVLSEKLANNKRNLTKAFGQGGKRDEANDPLGLR